MKDDLISRETAIHQTMGKLDYVDTIFDKPTESEIVYMLRSLPTVPAAPLDELCRFLGEAVTPCILLNIGCPYNEATHKDCDSCRAREAWKITLSKWMEEQNAAD